MSKETALHVKDGKITGKTVTERSGGYTKTTEYKPIGKETIFGQTYSATSTTTRDPKGNTRTKTY